MENRAANIIQETRKHVKKKPSRFEERNKGLNQHNPLQQPQTLSQMQSEQEIQLKASRDVRWQLYITGSYDGLSLFPEFHVAFNIVVTA